jgi:hypothetical protein
MPEMKQKAVETYGKLPIRFEANRGQTGPQVDFLARGSGYTLYLTATEAVLVMRQGQGNRPGVLRMKLIGANPAPQVAGLEQLPGTAHYFIGNDPRAWRTSVPTFARVEYRDVYPGVSLVYYGSQGQLEYDFVVAPGADPEAIRLSFAGTDRLEIDARGDLVIHTAAGVIRQHKPVLYQEVNGVRREVSGGYLLKDRDQIAFQVAAYDASRPLVIDPVLTYSTFLGGGFWEEGKAIAVDGSGNAYVTGLSESLDFPAPGGTPLTPNGPTDAFVAKFDASGALVYSAFLGGNSEDTGLGIAVDRSGNVYVTGFTHSTNFPTLSGFQSGSGGLTDAFVMKLDVTGRPVYSSYLGGSGFDEGRAIAVDASGNAYVTGVTFSPFPTLNPFQAVFGGGSDAFVAKVDAGGSALVFSTYLGGSGSESGHGIAVDVSGNAYVTGQTSSANFPTANAFQSASGGTGDAFVTKLSPAGVLAYSTYLGGSSGDEGLGIAVDGSGNAHVTGGTGSINFPNVNALQAASGGGADGFVTKFNASGSTLLYSTYLGGDGLDKGIAIAVDGSGNAYVTGQTDSSNFPKVDPPAAASGTGVGGDAFVTKLNPAGSALVYSTYLGGGSMDAGTGIAVDGAGHAYVVGDTTSFDFPTVNPSQPELGGEGDFGTDAFVAMILNPAPPKPDPTPVVVPFAPGSFTLREADLDRDDDEFDRDAFKARFTLGDGNDGIKPLEEGVTIQVGSASVTIKAGYFRKDRKGRFNYEGKINGVKVKASIRHMGGDSYKLTFKGKGEDTHSYARHRRRHDRDGDPPFSWYKRHHRASAPITVALTIGDCTKACDTGSTAWTAKRDYRGDRDDHRGGDDRDEQRNGHRGRRR